jgi:hypothetical protein
MANSKISALTAATTPVAGTEVLPIVQSSATVKLAISDLTPGLSTITAAKGGTGQTSYAVGDLLYANTTTTLAKLADVATGNALISGGVGVAPSYGKIGLTTHVSGTLPVANGGTNLTSFTANGLVYASSTSALATGSAITFDGTNFATTGTATASKLIPTGSSAAGNGLYLPAANALGLSTNGTNAVYINSSQNVGIGTTSPTAKLDTATSINLGLNYLNVAYDVGSGNGWLGGYNVTYSSAVKNVATGALTAIYYAGDSVRFYTNASAAAGTTASERMRIDLSGNVLVTNPAGLGYGTGAGGTVTQGTSRTTGVTLSKPTGAITMFSAAGSIVAATFTVTNTLVAATDTIILNQKSGTNLYVLLVTAVAAGSFNITFYTTGGVATDAPVINFTLIKGVTA